MISFNSFELNSNFSFPCGTFFMISFSVASSIETRFFHASSCLVSSLSCASRADVNEENLSKSSGLSKLVNFTAPKPVPFVTSKFFFVELNFSKIHSKDNKLIL